MFFSTRTAKKPVANYILELRKKEATFRQAVARIFAENNVKTAPIPVVSIARNLGFSVYASAFKDETISGIMADSSVPVSPFQEKRVIVYNREDYPLQQHFTVAHEIAHFVLHCNTTDNFYERYRRRLPGERESAIERTANAFAAQLVMPDDTVQDYLSTLPFTTTRAEIVFGMTRKFFVSSETAERRLFEMGY